MDKRSSGILLHISSLPSNYGIGAFGKEAYKFVDFLVESGQSFWQILPLGITGFGDSPYQSVSAFAGNYYFIDLDKLVEEGFIKKEDLIGLDFKDSDDFVNYDKIYDTRLPLLRKAYKNKFSKVKKDVYKFVKLEKIWLEDFALYMALKTKFNRKTWQEWDLAYRDRDEEALEAFKIEHKEEVEFWYFVQYLFFKQWDELKNYANSSGVEFIGDLPIYVAEDSSDVWASPELYKLNNMKKPIFVSGCPPDDFAITGQLWGNPIYDWKAMKKNGYKWWIERMDASSRLFDIVRIDHFRGFEAYWEIPSGDKTAENGEWVKGPGVELFDAIKKALGSLRIIAEDLGYLTKEFHEFKDATGFPGMNLLQFAFDARDENNYLPHAYIKNSVVYTGTHDNNTTFGWFTNDAKDEEVEYAKEYLRLTEEEGYAFGFIRACFSSVSNLAIIPMQDYLELDEKARFNIPSTIGGNWIWRMKKDAITKKLTQKIYKLTKTYWRLNKNVK
ncbi:4-alpha-glucanotransferase [Helicovermis profundi]|uniref:4-alpha-glucanotransferase n=1 Tax=Helicovermis profundi TaxID=3065157 RepID=A0AAU9EB94_9FIRM|nr:4-alpha-glucanotransferase [Clostridia bacterium S502]